jgi:hypothetical protein
MPAPKPTYFPWEHRAFLSIDETAEILSRSPIWVRRRLIDGRLIAYQLTAGGPSVVSVASVRQMIDSAQPVTPCRPAEPTHLRLVAST